jgi:integrase
MTKWLRAAATVVGADPSRISCHSLRSGGATALLAAGVDSTRVMQHGRWRSDVFQRYTRYDQESAAALSSRMAGGSSGEVNGREPAHIL